MAPPYSGPLTKVTARLRTATVARKVAARLLALTVMGSTQGARDGHAGRHPGSVTSGSAEPSGRQPSTIA